MGFLSSHFLERFADVNSRPSSIAGLAVLSILPVILYIIAQDFLRTYLKRPRHFAAADRFWKFSKPTAKVPLVELAVGNNYQELLARGSKLYPDRAFKIPHYPHELVIVPNKWMDAIKGAPESTLNFQQGNYDFLLGKYTGITGHDRAVVVVIQRDIARFLDQVFRIFDDEAAKAIASQIGPCDEWTSLTLLPVLVRMVVGITQSVFVGDPLCRDERWLRAITNCTVGAFGSVAPLWQTPWYLRPFVAWRLPALRKLRVDAADTRSLLAPVLQQRLKSLEDPAFKPPMDVIQLLIDDDPKGAGRSVEYQANAQVNLGRASLFTTSLSVFKTLYDLATHPEYIEPLRDEAMALSDGPINRTSMAKHVKLDSFVREVQRFYKLTPFGAIRKVLKPFKLPDGTVLPVGTVLGIDIQNAVFDNSTLENPYEFDGFRFERLRSLDGNENKYQSTTVTRDHVLFGYGPQSCPGRFFAMYEVKVILLKLLMNYDFKLKKTTVRDPLARMDGLLMVPDPTIEFLFKCRTLANAQKS